VNCDPNNLSRLSSCLRCLTDAQLMQIRTYLLCQWAMHISLGTPNAPTNPDITVPSTAANIVVTWTNPSPVGTTNEIWRSADGVTFNLFSTVSGGATQVTDSTGLAAGSFFYYKVRSCNGTNCSAFSTVISACNTYVSPNVASISFPTLIRAFGATSFQADGLAALTSVSLPALKRTDGNLDLANNPNLTSLTLTALQVVGTSLFLATNKLTGAISFPALTFIFSDLQVQSNTLMTSLSAPLLTTIQNIAQLSGCTALASINFNSLQTVGNFFLLSNDTSLTTLSLPALVSVGNDFQFDGCTSLTSASFPSLTTLAPQNFFSINGSGCTLLASLSIPVLASVTDGFTFTMNACALNAASVNLVLHRGTTWAVVGSDFELAAGTNAAPSGAGVADKATLIGQGNVCNTN
jgi:hypothetical protein